MAGRRAGLTVDCHAHVVPTLYVQELVRFANDPSVGPSARWYGGDFAAALPNHCTRYFFGSVAERVEVMDRAGVDVQVLSPGSSLAFRGPTDAAPELVRTWNDAVHAECEQAPNRFKVVSGLPLTDVDACLSEIARVAAFPNHVGFGLTTHVAGAGIDDARLRPVLERLDRLRSVVFLHPDGFRARGVLDRSLSVDLGTQFEDTLVAVSLYSGLTAKYPNIQWVVSHLGGALAFVLERLDEHWERDQESRSMARRPSHSLDRIHFDTAGHGPRAIRFASEVLGTDSLLLGSDFPMVMADEYDDLIDRILSAVGEADAREMVSGANAQSILGL